MTLLELREKSTTDLQTLLTQKRSTLRELTFKASEMQLKQVHSIASVKRDIARILTVLSEANKTNA